MYFPAAFDVVNRDFLLLVLLLARVFRLHTNWMSKKGTARYELAHL